jgi:hypothetical protein
MPLRDLTSLLGEAQISNVKVLEAVTQRADKEQKDPLAGALLAWVAKNEMMQPNGSKALTRLLEQFPDNPAIEQICTMLNSFRAPPNAADLLKIIYEKATKDHTKAMAALGLGKALANKVDDLGDKPAEADKVAAEAEKYFTAVIDTLAKDDVALRKQAEQELKIVRTLRVGKEAPDIAAGDLDGKDFKLSDYRGKVVLLDFWGNW